MSRPLVVVNRSSGTDDGDDLLHATRRRLGAIEVLELATDGERLQDSVGDAARDGRAVVALGGDGTVNAVVQHLPSEATLGVLPGGTRNHFAKDLGLGRSDEALAAVAAGRTRPVDAAAVNGRLFVNTLAVGIYPEIVEERERSSDRLGKLGASALAAVRVIRGARPLRGTVEADGDPRLLLAWILFAGVNAFGPTGRRERLDAGELDLRIFTAHHRHAWGAAWRTLRREGWTSWARVRRAARRVVVELEAPRRFALDGEVVAPSSRLEVELLPGRLRVLAP